MTPDKHVNSKQGCPKCAKNYKLDTDSFINKARLVHGEYYDYSKCVYKDTETRVCIICPEHGEFWQTPNKHLLGQGCVLCHRPVHNTESFIKKAKDLYGDLYDYSKVEYTNEKKKIGNYIPVYPIFPVTN